MKGVERDLIKVQEAAELLGFSVQAVHQGLRRGLVRHEVVAGRKMG
jgi:DNA-directed RNA polymerase specialized sigma24 family protein